MFTYEFMYFQLAETGLSGTGGRRAECCHVFRLAALSPSYLEGRSMLALRQHNNFKLVEIQFCIRPSRGHGGTTNVSTFGLDIR